MEDLKHLGYGVYLKTDGYHLILYEENWYGDNYIYLNPDVVRAFRPYIDDFEGEK